MKLQITATVGGFKIKDLKKLEVPIDRGILDPHIYEGTILNLPMFNDKVEDVYCTWDSKGRCSNWQREDCFIIIPNTKNTK